MKPELLHVVTCIFNPLRWESRMRLYATFERHMLSSGVRLTTVECQLGEREFVLDHPDVHHVRVRNHSLLFNKENLLALGIQRLPPDWRYLAWIDADVSFRRPDWATETLHALQQYAVVQPWADVYNTGPQGEHISHFVSFARVVDEGGPLRKAHGAPHPYRFPHPGFAWAMRRESYDHVGGLIETAVLGSGDHHMAMALVGQVAATYPQQMSDGYKRPLLAWQALALKYINQNLGYVWGTIEAGWHGRIEDRQYQDRWSIFLKHQFDPATDLKRNSYGVLELSGSKPQLRRAIDHYLRSRREDGNLI
jgi:hypothetical protein